MKRRVEITVETSRVLLTRGRTVAVNTWCAPCGGRVRMLTPEEAARLVGGTLRSICRRVESGSVHFTETADGSLLICPDSLQEAD